MVMKTNDVMGQGKKRQTNRGVRTNEGKSVRMLMMAKNVENLETGDEENSMFVKESASVAIQGDGKQMKLE